MIRRCALTLILLVAAAPAIRAQEDAAALEQTFAAAARHVAPSLVGITMEWKPGKAALPATPAAPSYVRGNGPVSGVIISADGLIATSDFGVNSDVKSLKVKLADGRTFDGTLLGNDVSRGIQIIRIDAKGLPVPRFAQNGDVRVGRWAIACGFGETPSLSVGIVSATERIGGRAIQVDASTNPTNYGGAIVDVQGRLMGIITPLTAAGTRAGLQLYDSGIGFAVPIGDIMSNLPRLEAGETVQAAFLGISFDMRKMTGGAYVQQVLKDTGAEKAGILTGDAITEFNGEAIHTPFKLLHVIGKCRVGDTVTFKVLRDGKPVELTATLGPRPTAP